MGNCNHNAHLYNPSSAGNKESTDDSDSLLHLGQPIHQGSVLGLSLDSGKEKLFTCSDDKRIAIIGEDYFTLGPSVDRRIEYLEGHTRAVNRLCVHGNFAYSASRDLSLRQVLTLIGLVQSF
jgi:hypothetical protein